MNKKQKSIISLILCLIITVVTFLYSIPASASQESDLKDDIAELQSQSQKLEKEIKKLKSEKASQQTVVNAIQKKIANTQAQILRCNREIDSINSKIQANKNEINKKNSQIDNQKLEFKKRLRAIYMSNSDSNVSVLMGADSFADYLQLAQLTASVSKRDRAMIEDLKAEIEEINAKNAENQKLLDSQVAIKDSIASQQKQLQAEEDEAAKILKNIAANQSSKEADNKEIEAEIKAKQKELQKIVSGSSGKVFINSSSGLAWPVPSCFNVYSKFGPRWGRNHNGIDISGGGIYGKPIVAIADGYVYYVYSSCTHRAKSPQCSCGGGYGNYVAIDHGTMKLGSSSSNVKAYYAHMDSVATTNGAYVKQGQVIGYVGTTGRSTGYHLHFGIMINNAWKDPMNYYRTVK